MNGGSAVSAIAWTAVVICLVVVLVGFGLLASRAGRSASLKRRFGTEYDRRVETTGDRRQAEDELAAVVRARRALTVTPLSDHDRARFRGRWADVQARFVDDPVSATHDADRLVVELMAARGYRTEDEDFGTDAGFDLRAGLLGYDHPETVAGYRSAHTTRIASGGVSDQSTEQLRTALVHYRTVFVRLVDDGADAADPRGDSDAESRQVSTA
jgi:hypothetical protein